MPTHPHPIDGVLGIVLAGGRGTRLGALTRDLAKPAVPIGGNGHRLIDFTLSNCLNSGVRRVGVLTQYRAESLTPHLDQVWSRVPEVDGRYATVLPPGDRLPYQGTAHAVHCNLAFIRANEPRHVLVLAGDHLYRMDYRRMLDAHLRSGVRVTVGCVEVPIAEASDFGVMHVESHSRIVDFHEKPHRPASLPGRPDVALASMGIYLFDTDALIALLDADARDPRSTHDFGHDVVPRAVRDGLAGSHSLCDLHHAAVQGYWRDVGTVDAYFRASFELHEHLLIGDPAWPIRCASAFAERYIDFDRWVIHSNATIGPRTQLECSIVLDGASVGADCRIRNAIVAPGLEIPDGTVVGFGTGLDRHLEMSPGGVFLLSECAIPIPRIPILPAWKQLAAA